MPFNCVQLKQFSEERNFINTSNPYYFKSNDFADTNLKIAKQLII